MPAVEIKVGDRFGLWEVIGEPTLSTKGKVVGLSKYPCRCLGSECKIEKSVVRNNLIYGRSAGCRSCRTQDAQLARNERQGIPCPRCGEATRKGSENKGHPQRFHCTKCKRRFTTGSDWYIDALARAALPAVSTTTCKIYNCICCSLQFVAPSDRLISPGCMACGSSIVGSAPIDLDRRTADLIGRSPSSRERSHPL